MDEAEERLLYSIARKRLQTLIRAAYDGRELAEAGRIPPHHRAYILWLELRLARRRGMAMPRRSARAPLEALLATIEFLTCDTLADGEKCALIP